MQWNIGYPVNRNAPLNRDLLSWWLRPPVLVSNARWLDLCNKSHGTLMGNPLWSGNSLPGGWGSLKLDGTGDYVAVGNRSEWSFTTGSSDTAFALSATLYITDISPTQGIVAKWGFSTGAPEWLWFVTGSVMYFSIYHPDGATQIGRYTILTTGAHQDRWFSATCTYDGSEVVGGMRIYINGDRVDTNDSVGGTYTGMVASVQPVEIGSYNVGGNLLSGGVNDVRISNRNLLADEVARLYQAQRTGYQQELNWLEDEEYRWARRGPRINSLLLTGVGR